MLVLLLVVMVFMVVVRVMDSSVYLSCDQMGSVTEVGRVHSIWQLCHLKRREFTRWTKLDHKYICATDGDNADKEDYPGDEF